MAATLTEIFDTKQEFYFVILFKRVVPSHLENPTTKAISIRLVQTEKSMVYLQREVELLYRYHGLLVQHSSQFGLYYSCILACNCGLIQQSAKN